MTEIIDKKVYILLLEDNIIGVWSNLSILVRDCQFIADNKKSFYQKIYRHLKSHEQTHKSIKGFKFEFEANNQTFNLKTYPLNEPINLKDLLSNLANT
ncbi:MAG: hypothetical protein RLZZ628_3208 [Bacteroidota bacterium]|jgi:hypothetical protein